MILQLNKDNFSSIWFSEISTSLKTTARYHSLWRETERCWNSLQNTPCICLQKGISNDKGVHFTIVKMSSCLALASGSPFPVLVTYSNIGRQLSGLQDNHIAGPKKKEEDRYGRLPISVQRSLWAGAKDNRVASKAVWDSCTGRELQRQKRRRKGGGRREREWKRESWNLFLCHTVLLERGRKKKVKKKKKGGRERLHTIKHWNQLFFPLI